MPTLTLYANKAAYFTATSNYGSSTILRIGNFVTKDHYAALDFPINSNFNPGTTINSATLYIRKSSAGSGSFTIYVKGINGSWSETSITNNSLPSLGSSVYSALYSGQSTWSVNVTSRVQYHVDNPTRYGFYLYHYADADEFLDGYSEDSSYDPYLVVSYTLPDTNDPPTWGSSTVTSPTTSIVSNATTSITVDWGNATDPESDPITYQLYCSTNGGTYTSIYSGGTSSYTHTIATGNPGYTYRYQVRAKDNSNAYATTDLYSGIVTKNTIPTWSSTTVTVAGYSAAKTVSAATTSLIVDWENATDVNSGQTLTYTVYRSLNGAAYESYATGITSSTYEDKGVAAGSTYAYRIYVSDGLQNAETQITSATITINARPTWNSTTVTAAGSSTAIYIPETTNTIVVDWADGNLNVGGSALKYDVYRSVSGGVFESRATNLSASTYTDSGATGGEGASYAYKIYITDGIDYATTQITSSVVTKNTFHPPTLSSIASISYSTTTVTKTISWTAASNTNGSAVSSYKISSSDITIVNATVAITSGYALPIYISGTVPTGPYITFASLKTKFAGSSYIGTFNITLTATNTYGSTETSIKAVSVNLQTVPTAGTAATPTGGLVTIGGSGYYIPGRQAITISWTRGTDPLGGATTCEVQAKIGTGTYSTIVAAGSTATSTTYNTFVSAASSLYIKVITKTSYNTTNYSQSSAIPVHFYNPPIVAISSYDRSETSVLVYGTTSGTAAGGTNSRTSIAKATTITSRTFTETGPGAGGTLTGTLPALQASITSLLSSSVFNVTFTVQDAGGVAVGTAAVRTTISISAFAPMFSIREKGVAVNSLPANDGYKFRVAGNVLISPDSSGESSLYVQGPLKGLNGNVYVHRNWGGKYIAASANTGTIQIELPFQNVMFTAKISIRCYNYSASIIVGGYTYTSTSNWHSTQATGIVSGSGNLNVRFNGDASHRYIYIGETTTAWGGYLQVSVDEVASGNGGDFSTPFTISLTTAMLGTTAGTHLFGPYSLPDHTHGTYDRASSVLSGANVFSNIVVTDGIVTSTATRALTAADVGALPTTGASFIQSSGRSASWSSTNGTSTGGFNTIMGTTTGATWLWSGTSGGTFRYGAQGLDAGGMLNVYAGTNIYTFGGATGTIWTSGNDGSGSGLDADTVDTYAPASTATASTLALRDANGYIYATGFNSTLADTTTAASHYLVETGSDGWQRPKTLANVKTELLGSSSRQFDCGTSTSSSTSGGDVTVYFNHTFSAAPRVVIQAKEIGASHTPRLGTVTTTYFIWDLSGTSKPVDWIAML